MARNADRRGDPRTLWPDARAIVMLGINYGPHDDPLAILKERMCGAISVYAQGDDYHDLIKTATQGLARWLVAKAGGDVKVFVDTAPVMEKPLAQAAGLGWQGKHTNLVSRAHRLVAVSRRDLHHARAAARCARSAIIAARAALASTSARPRPFPRPIGSMRGAAFPISRSSTRVRFRARCAQRSATASMAATIASRSVPGTNSRKPGAKRSLPPRAALRAPPLAELARLDDAGFPRAVRQERGQAHRTRPLPAQCAHRDRQLGRRGAGT